MRQKRERRRNNDEEAFGRKKTHKIENENNNKKEKTPIELFYEKIQNNVKLKESNNFPSIYSSIFFKILNEESIEVQNEINKQLRENDLIEEKKEEKKMENISLNMEFTEELIASIHKIHKNISIMSKITKSKKEKINSVLFGKKDLEKIEKEVVFFEDKLEKFEKVLESQKNILNENYKNKINNQVNLIDKKYNIYNKNYLRNIIKDDLVDMNKNQYNSSMLLIKLNNIEQDLKNENKEEKISNQEKKNKMLISFLKKMKRGNDIIININKDIFLLYLKYTNIKNSITVMNRMHHEIKNVCMINENGQEKGLELHIGISNVQGELNEILKSQIILDKEEEENYYLKKYKVLLESQETTFEEEKPREEVRS
jgi:hypothetical protein